MRMRTTSVLAVLIVLMPVWGLAVLLAAVFEPGWRPYLAVPVSVLCLMFGGRLGMLLERHMLPLIRNDVIEKPWVPIHTVVLDVARAVEDAQANPRSRWFWMNLRGEASFDYVKLADVAVQAAARSAINRRRSAAVRKMLDW